MTATEEQAPGSKPEVARPSSRTLELPRGPTPTAREERLGAIAECLLEIRAWRSAGEIGDTSFIAFDTDVGGKPLYVQFISEPGQTGLLCEVASGVFGDASVFHPTPEQGRAMVALGFSDGRESNFRKELVFDAPEAAASIAEQTVSLLGAVFGWSPDSAMSAKIVHDRRVSPSLVLQGLSPGEVVELLTRHGLVARLSANAPGGAAVEASIRGAVFTFHLTDRIEKSSRYRLIAARARVGSGVDGRAANPFNAMTWVGRSWVSDGEAFLEASLGVVGLDEDAFHYWLERWDLALRTARYWYRRVGFGVEPNMALVPLHFTSDFHNAHRIARCHVKQGAEEASLEAFSEFVRSPERKASPDGIDAWAFFERYSAANPDAANPVECEFVSSATAADLVPWLERIDGVQATVTASGELEVRHAIPGGALLVAPGAVRKVALSPERFALVVTVAREGGLVEVLIGPEDFFFTPGDGRLEFSGASFVFTEMPARMGWFEVKHRLRALERDMAWAGTLHCGATLAWMNGALAGAERVGLACDAERLRFNSVLEGARRSWQASSAAG